MFSSAFTHRFFFCDTNWRAHAAMLGLRGLYGAAMLELSHRRGSFHLRDLLKPR